MKPMTHGEIRGTLLLIAIMAAIVLTCHLTRSCNQSSPNVSEPKKPASEITTSTASTISATASTISATEIDSIRMEQAAAAYARKANLRKTSAKSVANPLSAKSSKKSSQKSSKKTASRSSKRPQQTPSPLDRPIPSP